MPPNWGRTTFYNGIRMRSRLEASFAAWLDRHELEWSYEGPAFGNPARQYLPDFTVTSEVGRIFVEVKPKPLSFDEIAWRADVIRASIPNARLVAVWPASDHVLSEWMIAEDAIDELKPYFVRMFFGATAYEIEQAHIAEIEPVQRSRVWLPEGPEENALRALIHTRDAVSPWLLMDSRLTASMFGNLKNLAAFTALASAASLHEAIESADTDASELLLRLSIADPDSTPEDAVAGLVREAARRSVVASKTVIPLDVHQALVAINEPETRDDSIDLLLAWMGGRDE